MQYKRSVLLENDGVVIDLLSFSDAEIRRNALKKNKEGVSKKKESYGYSYHPKEKLSSVYWLSILVFVLLMVLLRQIFFHYSEDLR
jgi:hypothetical protein